MTRDKNGDDVHVEQQELTVWAGALPSPDDLTQFNLLIPNGAERIMRLTEKEQDHRIALEQQIVPKILTHRKGASGWVLHCRVHHSPWRL